MVPPLRGQRSYTERRKMLAAPVGMTEKGGTGENSGIRDFLQAPFVASGQAKAQPLVALYVGPKGPTP